MITDREVVKRYIDAVSDMTGNGGKAKALEALERLCAIQSQPPAKPLALNIFSGDLEPVVTDADLQKPPAKPEPRGDALDQLVYLIYYDDRDRPPEIVIGEAVAMQRFKAISDSWSAHLFVSIANSVSTDQTPVALLASSQGQGRCETCANPCADKQPGMIACGDWSSQTHPQPSGLSEAARALLKVLDARLVQYEDCDQGQRFKVDIDGDEIGIPMADLRATLAQADREREMATFLHRQIEWSRKTFGSGKRTLGILRHIEKEIQEVKDKPTDLSEWIDIIILAIDGYWRHGGTPESLMADINAKAAINYARVYPTPTSEDEAVEHIKEPLPQPSGLRETVDRVREEIRQCAEAEIEAGGNAGFVRGISKALEFIDAALAQDDREAQR